MTQAAPESAKTSGASGAPEPAASAPAVVLLFSDDSTLFFANRMRAVLQAADPRLPIKTAWITQENALSYRQLTQLLPEGPDLVIDTQQDMAALLMSPQVRAVLTSRVFRTLGDTIRALPTRLQKGRACVVAFLGGLDFTPKMGYQRRRHCDAVYLFPEPEIATFETMMQDDPDRTWQQVGFGHPTFLAPQPPPDDLATRRDIYFFAQALSPSTARGRRHLLRAMAAIARAHPERTVWIKLRHLPAENQAHLHRERYDYPGLAAAMPDLPGNLRFTACTMDAALETAALGITCTSTAAIDVIRAGIPAMVHLDFVDAYRDPLVGPMRKLFAKSGVIVGLEDMLHLRAGPVDPTWQAQMFCPRDLGARVLDTIAAFHERPGQIAPDRMPSPEASRG